MRLRAEGIQPVLIVLDTLARLMVGGDENSAKDMGLAIEGIDRLRKETSATILVVHHTRKDGQIERGSNALRAAADVMIECKKFDDQGDVVFECKKMKDAAPFKKATLQLEPVPVGSSSSLAIAGWCEDEADEGDDSLYLDKAMEILKRQFGSVGASHKDLKREFMVVTGKSASTFARVVRKLKIDPRVRYDGKKYFAEGG